VLNLFPDQSFFLRRTYLERNEVKPIDDIGRWTLSSDGSTLILKGGKESSERFAVKRSDTLRALDLEGREIESKLNYDLRRSAAFERIEPRLSMRGMFRYMADAAIFSECQTGQRWPVAMEAGYKALEAAYSETRRQPGEELLVSVEGQVAMRPGMDGGQPTPTLIVERYIGIWPGETCGAAFATSPLQETYWKLTRLGDKPVILAEKQREPHLVFRSEQNRLTGFGGCNRLTGSYSLKGNEVTFGPIAATRMACVQGMELEGEFFKALEGVRTWKILGEHLELYGADGRMLARFEARALK
jgi:copper homeostasis protein (lipoprotein)